MAAGLSIVAGTKGHRVLQATAAPGGTPNRRSPKGVQPFRTAALRRAHGQAQPGQAPQTKWMQLNTDKKELLSSVHPDHPAPDLKFSHGDPVPHTQEAKYLGSEITRTIPPKAAIKFRKETAESAFSKSYHAWCSKLPCKKAKSFIFHSTIVAVLVYGLDLCSLDK